MNAFPQPKMALRGAGGGVSHESRGSGSAQTDKDEREVRQLVDRLSENWARGDAQAYGAEFTDDCDYVAFDGMQFRGPTEPTEHLAQLFDTVLKDSRLEGEVESVRFVTPDAAVVHWTGSVAYPWQQRAKRRSLPGKHWSSCAATAVDGNRVPEHAGGADLAGSARRFLARHAGADPMACRTGAARETPRIMVFRL